MWELEFKFKSPLHLEVLLLSYFFRGTSVTPPSPPSDFLFSLFSLYRPRFAIYCEYCISTLVF